MELVGKLWRGSGLVRYVAIARLTTTGGATRDGAATRVDQRPRRKGQAEGATLVCGGGRPTRTNRDFFIEATIFTDVDPSMPVVREKIFGPVASIVGDDEFDDAVGIANDTLHGPVFSRDPEAAYASARRMRTGGIGFNRGEIDGHIPFGEFKGRASGARAASKAIASISRPRPSTRRACLPTFRAIED